MQESNEYRGHSLFNDVEDLSLRARNRAAVMVNIALYNHDGGDLSAIAANDLYQYFNLIAPSERKGVLQLFQDRLLEEGFVVDIEAATLH